MTEPHYTYRTLATHGDSLYKVKGSKHLGFAMHVPDEETIQHHIDRLRRIHHQANHVCYAWRLGTQGERKRSNDDGEPAHSAGAPILGQIEKYKLTYVLVAVVRYFGGTKLGVGGLMDAYRTAAAMALDAATIEEHQLMAHFTLHFGYLRMSEVMLAARIHGWNVRGQTFGESCTLLIAVPPAQAMGVAQAFEAFPDLRIETNGIY